MKNQLSNMFSLEGTDGSGKTTQIPLIKAKLESKKFEVKILKSPTTTILGEFIRKNIRNFKPKLRNDLFLLDIEQTLEEINGFDGNCVLLWDRYIDSFYTSNQEMTLSESAKLVKDLPRPRHTFLLDIDTKYIFSERQATLDNHSDPKWLRQKVNRYRQLASLEKSRFSIVDARLPKEKITDYIVGSIEKMINKKIQMKSSQ